MSSQEGPYPAVNTPGLRTRFLGGMGRSLGSRPGCPQAPARTLHDAGRGDWSGDPFPAPVLGPLTISSEPTLSTSSSSRPDGGGSKGEQEGGLTQASGVLPGRQDAMDLREHPHSFIFPTIWPLVYQLIKTRSLEVAAPSANSPCKASGADSRHH